MLDFAAFFQLITYLILTTFLQLAFGEPLHYLQIHFFWSPFCME